MSTDGQRFPLGRLVTTPGALQAFEASGDNPLLYLGQHLLGEWGDLTEADKQANEDALHHGARILSAYRLKNETRVWIITEADRSSTTILLPSEY